MRSIKNELEFQVDSGLVAVKFLADWCGPCKRLEPSIEKIEQEFGENVKFLSVEVDQVPTIAKKYGVRVLPTVLLLNNGKEVNRITGLVLIEPLRRAFRDLTKDLL
jgi:thioredoxin 1